METRIILTITHKNPIPDLTDKVAGRVWSLQGVGGVEAVLDDLVKFLDEEPKLEQTDAARAQPVLEPLGFEEWAKAEGIAEDLNFAKSHRPPPSRFYQHIHTNQVYMAWQYGITQP